MADDGEFGPIEAKTRAAIAALGELAGMQMPLAELAFALAQRIDGGATGMAMSANARELRDTLKAMTEAADDGDAARELFAQLGEPVMPTPLRDASAG